MNMNVLGGNMERADVLERDDVPYHTNAPKYPASVREVFHNRSDCPAGQEIDFTDREKGTGGKRRCRECIFLALRSSSRP